jgi:hypothetical protein
MVELKVVRDPKNISYFVSDADMYPPAVASGFGGTGGGQSGGTGGIGSTYTTSGNGVTNIFTIPHGLSVTPTGITVDAASPIARSGNFDVSGDTANIYLTYASAPASGLLRWQWVAALTTITNPAGAASGRALMGTNNFSGDGSRTIFTINHALGATPAGINVNAASPNARAMFDLSGDSQNIYVTYPFPPASGLVSLSWMVGAAGVPTFGTSSVSGAGTVGSVYSGMADGSGTLFTIPHGLGLLPTSFSVEAGNPNSLGNISVSGDIANIYVTYPVAPASGLILLQWLASTTSQIGPNNSTAFSGQNFVLGSGSTIQGSPIASPYRYTILVDPVDNVVKARDNINGTVAFTASGSTVESVFQNVINASSNSAFVMPGTYNLSSTFSGLVVKNNTQFQLDRNAVIKVPQGLSGKLWDFSTGALASVIQFTIIRGGIYDEQGTAARNWYLYDTQGVNTSGYHVQFNIFGDCQVKNSKGFHLYTIGGLANLAYINANIYQNVIFLGQNKSAVVFEHTGPVDASSFTNRNLFDAFIFESEAAVTPPVYQDVNGKSNVFRDCIVYDLGFFSSVAPMTVTANATNTRIIRGALTYQPVGWYDAGAVTGNGGVATFADDEYMGFRSPYSGSFYGTTNFSGVVQFNNSTLWPFGAIRTSGTGGSTILSIQQMASGQSENIYMLPGAGSGTATSTTISLWHSASTDSRLFFNHDGTSSVVKTLRQTSGGSVTPILFQIQDVPAATTVEASRITTSGTMTFSGGWDGAFSTTRSITATNSGAFAPLGFLTISMSGQSVKVPYFAV